MSELATSTPSRGVDLGWMRSGQGRHSQVTLRRSLILIITYVYHPDWRNLQKDVRRFVVGGAAIWLPAVVLPAVVLPARWRPAGGGPAGGAGGLLAVLLV